ncbi:hypothetical protein D9M73_102990 [compost metagenome]
MAAISHARSRLRLRRWLQVSIATSAIGPPINMPRLSAKNQYRQIDRPSSKSCGSSQNVATTPDKAGAIPQQHSAKRSRSRKSAISGTCFCHRSSSQLPPIASAQLTAASTGENNGGSPFKMAARHKAAKAVVTQYEALRQPDFRMVAARTALANHKGAM